jgi:hypothetical protein
MMRARNSYGSAVLLVLGVMTIILVAAVAVRRAVIFQSDAALERVRVEQQFRLADGILVRGIMHAKQHFEELMQQQEREVNLDMGAWPPVGKTQQYRGKITFFPQKTGIRITAQLLDHGICIKKAGCMLAAGEQQKGLRQYRVTDYAA